MAPSATQLEAALVDAANDIFRANRSGLTVNAVRKRVESYLGLDDGFFQTDDWKAKSKDIITTTAVRGPGTHIFIGPIGTLARDPR